MNPGTAKEAVEIFNPIKKVAAKWPKVSIVICPPFVYLNDLKKRTGTANIFLGAQDVFWEKEGAFTGEVSLSMIKNIGASYVILGHSERRAMGESNETVNKKTIAALKIGLKVILCVGEKIRDGQGEFLEFLKNEIRDSLNKVQKKFLKNLIIAYEPIWAIGKKESEAMSARDMQETAIYIKKILSEIYGREEAVKVPILYGGSVGGENAEEIIKEGKIDGLLVGHQSLNPWSFIEILKNTESL